MDEPRTAEDPDNEKDLPERRLGDVVVYGHGLFNPWDLAAGRPDKPRRPRPGPSGW